ncbi:MAG: tRNA pseudouridine(13) synthase TruD, partial [Candidatus Micrarchaeota archaeon]
KDRTAVTTQLVSCFALEPHRISSLSIKDVSINGVWVSDKKIGLGDLNGNRFTITLTKENCGVDLVSKDLTEKLALNDYLFPNFFGYQRFGSVRCNTHLVGLELLKGSFEKGVMNFLCFSEGERDAECVEARKRLEKEMDFKEALNYFPGLLKYERTLLSHLALHPHDFAGAFSRLPRNLQLLFVHAFQSHLFNIDLRERIKNGEWSVEEKGKLIGFDSEVSEEEEKKLSEYGLTRDSFRFKILSYLSTKGSERNYFTRAKDFQVLSESPLVIRFSLSPGVYATTLLDFLLGTN